MKHHVYDIDTRWSDLDMMGHVNNVVYMTYFESARVEALCSSGGLDQQSGVGVVVVQANISYRDSATHPSRLKVVTTLKSLGNTSLVLHHSLQDREGDHLYCEADVTCVCVSLQDGKPVSVPASLREWAEGERS